MGARAYNAIGATVLRVRTNWILGRERGPVLLELVTKRIFDWALIKRK